MYDCGGSLPQPYRTRHNKKMTKEMKKKYYAPMMEEHPLHLSAAICSGGNPLPTPTPPGGTPTPFIPAPARPKAF
jgi:hypothetical protein